MSTLVLNGSCELQMPSSFVDIDREEMEYIDGGWDAKGFIYGLFAGALAGIVGKGVSASWVGSVITSAVSGWVTSAIDTATIAIMYVPSSVAKGIALAALGGALSYGAYELYKYGKKQGKW